jgi:hypothetical protein
VSAKQNATFVAFYLKFHVSSFRFQVFLRVAVSPRPRV